MPTDLWTRRDLVAMTDQAFDAFVAGLRDERKARAKRADGIQRQAAAVARADAERNEANRTAAVLEPAPYGDGGRA
jgi:hypothetical protein